MKKFLLILTIIVGTTFYASAQSPVMKGNILIDAGIGWPTGNVIFSDEGNGAWDNYSRTGGPFAFGGRLEYMVADGFSIGLDGNYVTTGYSYDITDTAQVFDPNTGNYSDSSYTENFGLTTKRMRVMLRMNKHIVQNDLVDAYIGAGVGYRYVNRKLEGIDDEQDGALIPVAFRLAFGARFFFTENIGAHVELGAWGGAPLQMGLSFKL